MLSMAREVQKISLAETAEANRLIRHWSSAVTHRVIFFSVEPNTSISCK